MKTNPATETLQRTLKIFEIGEYYWWLAHTPEEALASYLKVTENDAEDLTEPPRAISEEALDHLTYCDEESMGADVGQLDHWRCTCGQNAAANKLWKWDGTAWHHDHGEVVGFLRAVNRYRRSFRHQLSRDLAEDPVTPRMFASSVY